MTHPPSLNPLVQRLLLDAPELMSSLERVHLALGPWPEPSEEGGHFLYFPEDALLGVSALVQPHRVAQGVRLSWLGCRGVWSPQQALGNGLQAQVLSAGGAVRVPEWVLHASDKAMANWWLQVAASSQQLVTQMAQMSFCTRHHTAEQSLASWLLMAWYNSPGHALQMPVASLQGGFGFSPEKWQRAWQTLHKQGAVVLAGSGDCVEIAPRLLAPLSGLACACHQKLQLQ